MPNRILRDWTDSETVDALTFQAEVFFTRLIMKSDDYGRFFSDLRLLKANLFPLRVNQIRDADLQRWIAECVNAGLVRIYEVNKKRYTEIVNFGQRLRQAKKRFPDSDETNLVSDMAATCQPVVSDPPPELEEETETEIEVETKQKQNPPAKKKSRVFGLLKDEFLKKAGPEYYFEGKDASALKAIEHKLKTLLKLKKDFPGGEPPDEEIIGAWKFILEKMPSGWVKENFTLSNINGQWNIIIEQLKNSHNGTASSKIKSKQERISEDNAEQLSRIMEGTLRH